jgi:hypothetical protein
MILSYLFKAYATRPRLADECAYYAICYTLDVTLGLLLIWAGLRVQHRLAQARGWTSLRRSGHYGDPPDPHVFARQLAAFMLIVLAAKVVCAAVLLAAQNALELVSGFLLWPLAGHPDLELLAVMVACPLCLNVAYVWAQDSLIKGSLGIGGFDAVAEDDEEAAFGLGLGAGDLSFKAATHENFDAEFVYSPTLRRKYASIDGPDESGTSQPAAETARPRGASRGPEGSEASPASGRDGRVNPTRVGKAVAAPRGSPARDGGKECTV